MKGLSHALLVVSGLQFVTALQPNPPVWPPSVKIFSPTQSTADIEAAISQATSHLWGNNGQFSSDRYALLFKPGSYHANVQVGYYTHVMGLGVSPMDVSFTPPAGSSAPYHGVYCPAGGTSPDGPGSLVTFWRVAENFYTSPTGQVDDVPTTLADHMTWAVSQAAPLRRIHVDKTLWLFQLQYKPPNDWSSIYASGGFLSNVLVTGAETNAGGQQQFLFRNSQFTTPPGGGAWNLVFSGVDGAPAPKVPANNGNGVAYTVVPTTPVSAEKPFITIDSAGLYTLQVPKTKWGSHGIDFDAASLTGISFHQVFVATPASINNPIKKLDLQSRLRAGLSVVLTPGIYKLTNTLILSTDNQVVLGLGLATLVAPTDGTPCIAVKRNTFGVRLSGVMLQASAIPSSSKQFARSGSVLLDWGVNRNMNPRDHYPENMAKAAANPSFIHDLFVRVGGPDANMAVNVETMVRISASFVVGDNVWLWRADHTTTGLTFHHFGAGGVVNSVDCRASHGLQVDGNNVTMLGLAVEHTQKDQVIWNGEGGKTIFYQTELPYDVNQAVFKDPATNSQYLGYNVNSDVMTHTAYGQGIYSYFRDYTVYVDTAIKAPTQNPGVKMVNPFTIYLNGNPGIKSVLNGQKPSTTWTTGYTYRQV